MSELGFDMIPGCMGIVALAFVLGMGLLFLADSFHKYDHCIKCGHLIHYENYCPNCGTSTDSVATYNYWEGRKL